MPIRSLIPPLALDGAIFPAILVLLFPLLNFILVLLLGKNRPSFSTWLSLASILATFLSALIVGFNAWDESLHARFYWLDLSSDRGGVLLSGGVYLDRLSLLMSILVSGISVLVFVFSQVYMKGDKHLHRYWSYLSLFVFSMLGIVLADNLLFIFIFWEMVGLSSYLLIGFWYEREGPARASQKAFLINRVGDVLFFSGLLMILVSCKSLDLEYLYLLVKEDPQVLLGQMGWIETGAFLMIGGTLGKSAQFPLQVWLPDAMEGPTPVSSLIHAATMVAAGIYLLARILLFMPPVALHVIAGLGALTALMAAIAALSQWDIKKVLAYSTLSQLGLMMMGMGVQAWDMSLFHLFTHAFFKCALFLVAGAIIHHLHHLDIASKDGIPPANDMRNMGGLKKVHPRLFYLYLPPMLALAGLPFFSGFMSKEGILVQAFSWAYHHGSWAWAVPISGMLTAFLTAFYIGRQAMLVFLSPSVTHNQEKPSSPLSPAMFLPIALLSLASLWFFWGLNPLEGKESWLPKALEGPLAYESIDFGHSYDFHLPLLLSSIALGMGGLAMAYLRYRKRPSGVEKGLLFSLSYHHFFQDRLYEGGIAMIFLQMGRFLNWVDRNIVDGWVAILGRATVNRGPEIDASSELSDVGDRGLDRGLDRVSHLLGPSLSSIASAIDHRLIDGLVNGFVAALRGLGKQSSDTQKRGIQGYLMGILLSLLIIAGIIIWKIS